MLLRGRARVLPVGELEQHLLDPLGGEILLRQRHAAVERFRVARNQPIAKLEEADALEHHRPSLRARHPRRIAEAIAGIAQAPVAQWIEEIPAKVRAGVVEVRQHVGDRLAAAVLAEKAVVADAVGREQGRKGGAVVGGDRGAEAAQQIVEIGQGLPLCFAAPER
jgi:hypothetical protein